MLGLPEITGLQQRRECVEAMKYAWGVGLVMVVLGCSSGGTGTIGQSEQTQYTTRDCVGDSGCAGTQACYGDSCQSCTCTPVKTACTSEAGCHGMTTCQGSACAPCVCDAPMPTWSTEFSGVAAELHAAPDGSVVVRLTAAPWLVRHDVNGQATPLTLQSALDWVQQFVISGDGSLYVLGTSMSGTASASSSSVRVDHLSSAGSLLGSKRWGIPNKSPLQDAPATDSTTFGGAALGPDGGIYVVAEGIWSRSVVKLTADGDFGTETTVPPPYDSSGNALVLEAPERLAVAADGSFLIEGGSSSLWIEGVIPGGTASVWTTNLAENAVDDSVYAAGVAPGPQGDWFAALGTGWTNSFSGLGYYQRSVVRMSNTGTSRWTAGDYFEPAALINEASIRYSAMAVLSDSVLLATSTPSTPTNNDDVPLSPDDASATTVRYTLNGKYAEAFDLGAVIDLTPLGPEAAAVLSAGSNGTGYTLSRFDFEPLMVAAQQAGQACSANTDCASGACCSSAFTQNATCAAANKCAQNDSCVSNAECSGSCVIAGAAQSGFCASACAASSDCPMNSFCIGTSCIPSCNSGNDCPFPGTQCANAMNTEAVSVLVCTGS